MKFSITVLQKRFRQFLKFGSIAEIRMSLFLLPDFRFTEWLIVHSTNLCGSFFVDDIERKIE